MPSRRLATRLLQPLRHLTLVALLCCATALHANASAPALNTCQGIKDLAFVGHMDDDLLFMNPDIGAAIQAGGCIRVVYLTASERNEGEDYMLSRERGVRAAYAYMAQQPDAWIADTAQIGNFRLASFTLKDNPGIQLWHMRLQDPWLGKGWGSLTPLSQAESVPGHAVRTLEAEPQTYTRQDLVETLARIIQGYGPTTIRHLDDTITIPYTELCWRCAGHGHPDHIASARLVREATALAPGNYAQVGYIDYPSQEHDSNLAQAEIDSKTEIFRRYAWVDYRYCKGPEHCQEPAGPAAAWVQRTYYLSRHDMPADLADMPGPDGGIQLLTTGEYSDGASLWSTGTGEWRMLGGRSADALAVAHQPDGTNAVFLRDALGRLWTSQQQPDATWQEWRALPGARIQRPPSLTRQGPAAAVGIGMGDDPSLYWIDLRGPALPPLRPSWAALPALPGSARDAAIGADASGRFVVLANTHDGRLFVARQPPPPSSGWLPWQPLDAASANGGLAILLGADGRLTLYWRDRPSGHLYSLTQQATAIGAARDLLAWDAATDLGLPFTGTPATALDPQGQSVVAVRGAADNGLWLIEQGVQTKVADGIGSDPALRTLDGTLHAAARLSGPRQQYLLLARQHGAWSPLPAVTAPPASGGGAFSSAR